ncbi:DinB family protein [Paractinoplanes lichenicola]|uniref:DinB family protein n=1 Tax=Paractinoplanes lichenicola TaxID=2802976 RepID=A0ABS1W516_9ACTN|nr:DinB family protein [Actinoplanes lichenicola]MBL7261836.1 DinB family protein [Actinoplanes lichenicola]
MPGQVGSIDNEQQGLLAYLAQMRYVLRLTAYGLTDEQLRATPSASELSVGGLIKHCASTEAGWMGQVRGEPQVLDYEAYANNFRLAEGESIDEVFARYDRVAEQTEKTVTELDNLDHAVPIDHSVPWNSKDMSHWTLRWILLHLVQETARHTGHADIVRESVDGATAYPLMAAAEGWPETDWLKPWKPGP